MTAVAAEVATVEVEGMIDEVVVAEVDGSSELIII